MICRLSTILWFLLSALVIAQNPTFTVQPSLVKRAPAQWEVHFAVSVATDVAVSIVNTADSTIVRHLAAGVLGANAPTPLAKNSLIQTLTWDGKNDLGSPVTVPDAHLRARVRAGMSTQLVGLLGGEPYSIGAYSSHNNLSGIVAGSDGSVYVAGMPAFMHHEHYGTNFITIRKFDKDGNYVKTLFPQPSNFTQEQVAGWGVINWPDGSYSPKNVNTSLPILTTTIVGHVNSGSYQFYGSSLQYMNRNGEIVFGSLNTLALKTDGSLPGNGQAVQLIKSPAWAKTNPVYCMAGHAFVTPLRNGKLLFSGLFDFTGGMGTATQIAQDTNFWRDGKVFLVDPSTGVATTWLAIDSVPKASTERLAQMQGNYGYAALQGTALDSSGRVYVCDRLHQRVGVYDTNRAYLGSLPVWAPHRVAVNGRTGNVYVVTQTLSAWGGASTNIIKIVKFAPFAHGGAPVCTLNAASGTMGRSGVIPVTHFAVNDIGGQTTLWIGMPGLGVRLYRDNGSTLNLVRDMAAESRQKNQLGVENPTPDRLVVDRRNENLLVNDSWSSMYKISDWGNPVLSPCSTSSKKRLYAKDVTISPDNLLYMFEGTGYSGPVTRYTLDRLHTPVPFTNTGQDTLTPFSFARYAPTMGIRGLAVAPDKRVAIMGLLADRKTYYVGVFADSGSRDISYGKVQIGSLPVMSGGVKYDLKGNLYLGAGYRTASFDVPDAFLSDLGLKWGVGSVFKFNGQDSGAVLSTGPVNAAKIYNLPLSPFSADPLGGCVCRSPRFDLDPYGRLFLPSAVTCQVSVADNEGNLIHRFGKYGNLDSRGSLPGLPTQDVITRNEIPMAWPTSVAASEDYLYISDFINYRIVRVQMVYKADNMPGFTVHLSTNQEDKYWRTPLFALSSGPVPFSGNTTVSVNLPGHSRVKLEVFDALGRCVRKLGEGGCAPGLNTFIWDGRNNRGNKLSAGLYVYRLTAGHRVLTSKTIIAK